MLIPVIITIVFVASVHLFFGKLAPMEGRLRAQDPRHIADMAAVLSTIRTGIGKDHMQKRSVDDWKRRHGSSAANVFALLQVLGNRNLPNDYKAFLRLNDGLEFFTHREPGLQFFDFKNVRWNDKGPEMRTLVECIIGKAAAGKAIEEIGYIEPLLQSVRTLRIERLDRVCLIAPEESRRLAEFWEPLLSHVVLSDDVRQEASQHYAKHFGGVSPLATMKTWSRWIVLEQSVGGRYSRIYPGFTEFLMELAARGEAEVTKSSIQSPEGAQAGGVQGIDEAQISESDCRMWKAILEPNAQPVQNNPAGAKSHD